MQRISNHRSKRRPSLLILFYIACAIWVGSPRAQTWSLKNTVPTTASLYGSIYANSIWFTVGNSGTILFSYNANTWNSVQSPTSLRLRSIAYGSSNYVAVCQNDSVLTSSNGTSNWGRIALGSKASLQNICFGNSLFAIAADSGRVFTSTNPTTLWTKRTTSSKARLNGIVWTGTQFIAAGDSGIILTSPTGTTWTKQTSNISRRINGLTVNAGLTIAVGDSGLFLSSDNGTSWANHSGITVKNLLSVATNGSMYTAVGPSDSIFYSSNGSTWQPQALSTIPYSYNPSFLNTISANSTQFVAAGRDGIILTSTDGINFKEQSDVTLSLLDICVQSSTWLTVGARIRGSSPMGAFILSGNGTNWTEVGIDVSPQILRCVARSPSLAVVMGATDTILTSSNLFNWTKTSIGNYGDFNDVVWNGSFFTAVNSAGKVLTSTNGTSWQEKADIGCMLMNLCWNGNQFLAVGDTGTIFTSSDAMQWTQRPTTSTAVLYGAAWNGTGYVVVGENATVLTSTNGNIWNEQQISSISAFTRLFSVCYNGFTFIATGENGTLLSSANGSAWNIISSGTSANLYSIAYRSTQDMVTVGNSGTILTYLQPATSIYNLKTTLSIKHKDLLSIVNGNTIHYSVEHAGPVSLMLLDLKGRLVSTLIDRQLQVGVYTVPLSGIAQGSYCVQMTMRKERVSKIFAICR